MLLPFYEDKIQQHQLPHCLLQHEALIVLCENSRYWYKMYCLFSPDIMLAMLVPLNKRILRISFSKGTNMAASSFVFGFSRGSS